MVKREDAIKFFENMKNPEFVKKQCKKYHESEERDCVYLVVMRFLKQNRSQEDLLLGLRTLLLDWNAGYYRPRPDKRRSLERDLRNALKVSENELKNLAEERLERIRSQEKASSIRKVFKTFMNHLTSGVSVTKALHVINPELFMVWDRDIRAVYHKVHGYGHIEGNEECYLKFMEQCRSMIESLLNTTYEEDIIRADPTYKKYGFRETLAKTMDECNYVFVHPEKLAR